LSQGRFLGFWPRTRRQCGRIRHFRRRHDGSRGAARRKVCRTGQEPGMVRRWNSQQIPDRVVMDAVVAAGLLYQKPQPPRSGVECLIAGEIEWTAQQGHNLLYVALSRGTPGRFAVEHRLDLSTSVAQERRRVKTRDLLRLSRGISWRARRFERPAETVLHRTAERICAAGVEGAERKPPDPIAYKRYEPARRPASARIRDSRPINRARRDGGPKQTIERIACCETRASRRIGMLIISARLRRRRSCNRCGCSRDEVLPHVRDL